MVWMHQWHLSSCSVCLLCLRVEKMKEWQTWIREKSDVKALLLTLFTVDTEFCVWELAVCDHENHISIKGSQEITSIATAVGTSGSDTSLMVGFNAKTKPHFRKSSWKPAISSWATLKSLDAFHLFFERHGRARVKICLFASRNRTEKKTRLQHPHLNNSQEQLRMQQGVATQTPSPPLAPGSRLQSHPPHTWVQLLNLLGEVRNWAEHSGKLRQLGGCTSTVWVK